MRFTQSCADGSGRLVALVESPTVGDTLKGSGLELGIIQIAEPRKPRIFLAKVLIHASVHRGCIVLDNWIGLEVLGQAGTGGRGEKF